MRYITEEEVLEFGSMKDTINMMEEAFKDYTEGNSSFSSRIRLPFPGGSYITMPGVFAKYKLAGLKTYVGNKKGIRHVLVFNTETSEPVAAIESSLMGQFKTGSLPAMVTRKLLKSRNQSLCVIGSGLQAEKQLEGILTVFDVDRVSVYSKTAGHAKKFSESMSKKFGIDAKSYESVKEALRGATVVNAVTNSNTPVFNRKDLGDSYHINLCGANIPVRREVADDALAACDFVVVEHMEQAMMESSEIMELREKHPDVKCVELKDIMNGDHAEDGRRTAFKSMGVGLEDVAAAASLLKNMKLL